MSNFNKKLSQISPEVRRILQCLSVYYEPVAFQEWQKIISLLDLKTPKGHKFSPKYISLLKTSLSAKGILKNFTSFWGEGFQIA